MRTPVASIVFLVLAACCVACTPQPATSGPETDGAASGQGASAPQTPAPQGRAIPPRFHGRWAGSPEACDQPGDESALEIRHDHVAFHESSGPVLGASDEGDRLDVYLHLTGEGESREARYSFRLEDEGHALVDTAADFRRVRCGDGDARAAGG